MKPTPPGSSAILRWARYADDWETHRSLPLELTTGELGGILHEIDAQLTHDRTLLSEEQEHEPEWLSGGWYDLLGLVQEVQSLVVTAKESEGQLVPISVVVLPWDDPLLLPDDGPQSEGICEQTADDSGFTVKLSEFATPFTVIHAFAHILNPGDSQRFAHDRDWFFCFLALALRRYEGVEISGLLASRDPARLVRALERLPVNRFG